MRTFMGYRVEDLHAVVTLDGDVKGLIAEACNSAGFLLSDDTVRYEMVVGTFPEGSSVIDFELACQNGLIR